MFKIGDKVIVLNNPKVLGKVIGSTNIFPSWNKEPEGVFEYVIELNKGEYLGERLTLTSFLIVHPDNLKLNK